MPALVELGNDLSVHASSCTYNFAVTLKRKVRGWPGEMLLLPSAENVKTVQRIEPTIAFGASRHRGYLAGTGSVVDDP